MPDHKHPDHKQEESFRVIDRRPFTAEGELRKDVVELEEREAQREAAVHPSTRPAATEKAAVTPEPPVDAPKRSPAFENLVRMLGSNAAMVLGAYADPRTGQPMLDLDGAREMIDMLDALREKTRGNLALEEETLVIDILGNLKLAFMEMTKAAAAAVMQDKAKSR